MILVYVAKLKNELVLKILYTYPYFETIRFKKAFKNIMKSQERRDTTNFKSYK